MTPQINGAIVSITTDDTDFVLKGRPLIELDKTDFKIALKQAEAELGNAVREVEALFELVRQLDAQIIQKKARFIQCAQDFEHRKALIEEGAVSLEDLEHAIAYLEEAFGDLIATEHAYISAIAQIENTTVETHPKVEYAKGIFRQAYVDLNRCSLLAPVTGIIAQRRIRVGQQVMISEPLLAIIPMDQIWIDANFKEIQLSKMRIGQPVHVRTDLWGSDVPFEGTVVGIGAGTGSVFSVLPPQNATGNWIKIVQRIPVRIALKPEEIRLHPLRLGMSVETTVDIHNTTLREIPQERPQIPLYETDTISHQEQGV
ncbi:MAG: HlyD family efflux transporter periplasmic adaptor subunit, partial [Chlamydiales bacterium]|nr:HlyD family efflux transporter periplasmic adaptor subunit [Chlamydiales bacterium]